MVVWGVSRPVLELHLCVSELTVERSVAHEREAIEEQMLERRPQRHPSQDEHPFTD
jgi:hypothetical protein